MFGINVERLVDLENDYRTLEDYQTDDKMVWCPGCGDYGVLTSLQKLCRDEQLPPEKTVFVSGIGCSSRSPDYMNTYGFHGLHGRALPIAQGIKVRRPDLHVFVNTGDGDCYGIGASHWIHALRYNMNMVVMVHDNKIYGLTRNQASPTSPEGLQTKTTPHGAKLKGLNALPITLASTNISFVAQVAEWIPSVMYDVLKMAYHHRGTSFINILQRCTLFMRDYYETDPNKVLIITHENGIQLNDALARLYKNQQAHDPADRMAALDLALNSELAPIGVLYQNKTVPCYEDLQKPKKIFTINDIKTELNTQFDSLIKGKDKMVDSPLHINGSSALALGIMASGMEICGMYPIEPALETVQYLSEFYENGGGLVHQAEDPISACAFALGASYAGKCAVTVTSGPGLALKTELLGLASSAEIPLVLIDIQRMGPSIGIPKKAEQGDLLSSIYGTPGDAPKVVMAPATAEDCFYAVISARKIAETFRMPVLILVDADLAKKKQAMTRPQFDENWMTSLDLSPIEKGAKPYDWNEKTGLSRRFIPGQPNGVHTLTSFTHDRDGKPSNKGPVNQDACKYRSLKLAALQQTLTPPQVIGENEGDLLIIGWGGTREAIETAVTKAQKEGLNVSALQLQYLYPLAPGIGEILKGFKTIVTVELNYSDDLNDELINPENRRYASLAWLLRARYLVDVDCWSNVMGQLPKAKDMESLIQKLLKR